MPTTLDLDTSLVNAIGNQRPRIENAPEHETSEGDRVSRFAELCGVNLDEWQRYVIHGMFARDAFGRWSASEFGLLVSRQNGKGEILVVYDLAQLFMFPRVDNRRKTILHSAHEMKTAIDGFQRLAGVIEANPKLMQRVKAVRTANGQEAIELKPRVGQQLGDRIKFIARSRNSGRGFSSDANVYDEAQELTNKARSALTYTQTQTPNRQEIFTGTAPDEDNESEVFEGVRDRGRSHRGRHTGWMEFTPEGSELPDPVVGIGPDPMPLEHRGRVYIDLSDRKHWHDTNPSLNIRGFTDETIEGEIERATDIWSLARERFSVWPDPVEVDGDPALNDLDLAIWDAMAGEDYRITEPQVISIALARGGQFATIGYGKRYSDEELVVEHKHTARGTLWVAAYVAAVKVDFPKALVVLDPKNAAVILTDLDKEGVKYLGMNLNELAAAYSLMLEMNNGQQQGAIDDEMLGKKIHGFVLHPDQAEVTASLKYAIPRAVGSAGFTWDASDVTKPITMAQAVTWAVWGVKKLESAPPPKAPAVVIGYA